MDNFDLENKKRTAADELFRMRGRSSMPHVPPFVQMQKEGGNIISEKKEEPMPTEPKVVEEKRGLLGGDILKLLDFKNFKMDSDRILLLLMVLILSGENSDEILMFALAYIML